MAGKQLQLAIDRNAISTPKRKSYTREYKLNVIKFYHDNDNNLYRTHKMLSLNTKTILLWINSEEMIRKSAKGAKHVKKRRPAKYPSMEEKLVKEYREMRKKGIKVKGWWFKLRSKQLLDVLSPGENFKFSAGWFDAFKRRHKIALRRCANVCQQPPSNKIQALRRLHHDIRQQATSGSKDKMINLTEKFSLQQMANVDQTPLPFAFTDGQTYSEKGEKSVWVRENQSGMNK